ncbi:uncharacterized protein LOC143296912 isoform X2 [Babylonia areolata]|uniref:uncharacterized protein LOC143296912 isoform X2 n=1 Tax=Babylonia areolata TaxID=304850 RepID=UPI003FD659DB
MQRGRHAFNSEAGEDRGQNGFRASQHHNIPGASRYPGTNPGLSQSVNDHLKELRALSSSNRDGRDFQNMSDYGRGPPQPTTIQGSNPGSWQQHGPNSPSASLNSSVPPPPRFNPSLPPPGLPPFHSFPPPPTVGPGGSGMMFTSPPPPFPQQGARPGHPLNQTPGAPAQGNVRMPPHSQGSATAAASVSSVRGAPPPQNNFRMGSPSSFHSPPPIPSRMHMSNQNSSSELSHGSVLPVGQNSFAAPPVLQKPVSQTTPGAGDSDSGSTGGQQEVNRWLQRKGKGREAAVASDRSKAKGSGALMGTDSAEKKTTLCISEAQDRLRSVLHALAAVQGELQHLEEQQGTADSHEWESTVHKIRQLKEAYLETKQKLDIEQVKSLKGKIDLRRKKRLPISCLCILLCKHSYP